MKTTNRKLTDVSGLLVLAVFALCLLCVLLTGARSYENLNRFGSESHRLRTGCQYLSTRVRQAEALYVESFGESQALVIPETVEGRRYLTRIYCHDGWLRELYSSESARLSPADGEKLLEISSLSFTLENGLLTARLEDRQLIFSLTAAGKEV